MSVQPKRELGQHWLVDENILGVIGRLAELHDEAGACLFGIAANASSIRTFAAAVVSGSGSTIPSTDRSS